MEQKKILVINPNTEEAMTEQIRNQLLPICPEDVVLDVMTNAAGPVSIEGHTDEIVSAYHILEMISENGKEYDGYLIACFSNHPSIAMLRELTGKSVIGIAEGACHYAALAGNSFAVVTTSPKWVPMLEEAIENFGLAKKCNGVYTSGLSVEELHSLSQEKVEKEIIQAGKIAVANGAEVIVLGCAGMSGMKEKLEESIKLPVIDSCEAGFLMLYGMCQMHLKSSRACMYAPQLPRKTKNLNEKIKRFYE